jgi:hypothetical protein
MIWFAAARRQWVPVSAMAAILRRSIVLEKRLNNISRIEFDKTFTRAPGIPNDEPGQPL